MKWRYWALANLTWIIVLPIIFGIWLEYVVQADYDSGARVSTDGDSIMIPIAGFALINFVAVVVFNLVWGLYALVKRHRAAQQGAHG
jgi:hypothetical protein